MGVRHGWRHRRTAPTATVVSFDVLGGVTGGSDDAQAATRECSAGGDIDRPAGRSAGRLLLLVLPAGFGIAVGAPCYRPAYYYPPPPVVYGPPPVVYGTYYPPYYAPTGTTADMGGATGAMLAATVGASGLTRQFASR
jgi:hypothetical protein